MVKKKKKQSDTDKEDIVDKVIPEKKVTFSNTTDEYSDSASYDDDDSHRDSYDPYEGLDTGIVSALRSDDAEIEELERKLGLSNSKNKSKLKKEYAKLEGFGDDFGDFLDGLDGIVDKVLDEGGNEDIEDEDHGDEDSHSPDDFSSADDEDSKSDFDDDDDDDDGDESDGLQEEEDPTLPSSDTYVPVAGEDIYGKKIHQDTNINQPAKYIPPHLRKKNNSDNNDEERADDEDADDILENGQLEGTKRAMKGILNRLSDSTLESTIQKIVHLYRDPNNASNTLNQLLCTMLFEMTVSSKQVLENLIPLYACLISGLHNALGRNVGAFVLEKVVTKFISVKHEKQEKGEDDDQSSQSEDDESIFSKAGSNLILLLCYFYNFHTVHCILMYDIIKNLIESFKEIDVEVLLLILNHAGKELRSDDPSALKDIVLLAKERAVQVMGSHNNDKSRIQYMLDAMNDLKNNNINKRRSVQSKQLLHLEEKIKNYRKILGRIKSNKNMGGSSGNAIGSDGSSLRISLQDIIDIPVKGRWWKTGASWVGQQHNSHSSSTTDDNIDTPSTSQMEKDNEQSKLLRLASLARMNTDLRKSIFCIIMSSSDCEDAFANLMRQQILSPHYAEVGRVLVECCVREKNYNPYYSHLGLRICEFHKKSKRELGKIVSDFLQRFDQNNDKKDAKSSRQAANLAKLSSHWLRHGVLKLRILESVFLENDLLTNKANESPMIIFLVMFFNSLFESMEDREAVRKIFLPRRVSQSREEKEAEIIDREGELRRSIAVFLAKYIVDSPKNIKGSIYSRNLKTVLKCCKTETLEF